MRSIRNRSSTLYGVEDMKSFALTIDVEPDSKRGSWDTSVPISFRGVYEGVEKIQSLANQFSVPVTYFIQPVVLYDQKSVDFFQSLTGRFELASHLHGEYIGPNAKYGGPDFSGCNPGERQSNYAPELERKKLDKLTSLFAQKFGYTPKSFRAGRFGSGKYTLGFLRDLGYSHDSSVIPRSKQFKSIKSPVPYKSKGVIEVPITIDHRRRWLRPTPGFSSVKDIREIMNSGYSTTCCMLHNVEVLPRINPYCESKGDCDELMDRLEAVLMAAYENKYVPVTVSEVVI